MSAAIQILHKLELIIIGTNEIVVIKVSQYETSMSISMSIRWPMAVLHDQSNMTEFDLEFHPKCMTTIISNLINIFSLVEVWNGDSVKLDSNCFFFKLQLVDEWGILATADAKSHAGYLKIIPKELKDQVKDSLKSKKQ